MVLILLFSMCCTVPNVCCCTVSSAGFYLQPTLYNFLSASLSFQLLYSSIIISLFLLGVYVCIGEILMCGCERAIEIEEDCN